MEMGRKIISVKLSEITDIRILAPGIYLLFAPKTLENISCFCTAGRAQAESTLLTCGAFVHLQLSHLTQEIQNCKIENQFSCLFAKCLLYALQS